MKRILKRMLALTLVLGMTFSSLTVFAAESSSPAKLRIYGTDFTVDGSTTVQDNYSQTFEVGDTVNLKAAGSNFAYWLRLSDYKLMSREETYALTLGGNEAYTNVYGTAAAGTAYVEYVSAAPQLVQAGTYSVNDTINEPAVPARSGYQNGRWEYTVEEIKGMIAAGQTHIEVNPEYDIIDAYYDVTIVYNNDTENVGGQTGLPSKSLYTAVAKEIPGKTFSHWSNAAENGDCLSYEEEFEVYVTTHKVLYAIYVDEGTNVDKSEPAIGISAVYSAADDSQGRGVLYYESYRDVPEDCTILSQGFLKTVKPEFGTDTTLTYQNYELGNLGLTPSFGGTTRTDYYTTGQAFANRDRTFYVRAFIQYQDSTGTTQYAYSNIWESSYNDWVAKEQSGELYVPVVPEKEPVQGTQEYPYELTAETTETAEIAAESNVYYVGYFNGTMVLTVEGEDAYVIYNGETYAAEEGVVAVKMTSSRMAPAQFQIGNAGTEAKVYPVSLALPLGSVDNPEVLEELGYTVASIDGVGFDTAYHYTYTAPEAGTVTIEMYAENYFFAVDNLTAGKYGDQHMSTVEDAVYLEEVSVNAGDVLHIVVNTPDGTAGEVAWYGSFAAVPGTVNNPITIEGNVTVTPEIAAGASVYYQGRLGGKILTINDADASVIYNGVTYGAQDGVVTIAFPEGGGFYAPMDVIEVVNTGDAAEAYTITLSFPAGHMENPEVIELGDHKATIGAGSQGYYYTYTAEEDGTLVITMKDASWTYAINNMTTYVYGEKQWSDSDPVANPAEVEVKAGDEIQIVVNTYDAANPWEAPEGEINWSIEYAVDDNLGDGGVNEDDGYGDIH